MSRFALAPMSMDIRVLTWIVLVIPPVLFLGAARASGPARVVLLGVTVFILILYASVWLWWRPTVFEVGQQGFRIQWPLRARAIPASEIEEALLLTREAFRREFGWGVRIGAGGLWGGFGWLYTRRGLLDLYVSRTDRLVLIRFRRARPLLVTPENDARFVVALHGVMPRHAPPLP